MTPHAKDINHRLDSWLKKNRPDIPYTLLQKLFRKKAIKVNGKAAKPDYRLQADDQIHVPLIEKTTSAPVKKPTKQTDLSSYIIYHDEDIIALNKPQGLSVQGGTGQKTHIAGSLDQFQTDENDPPLLVHRIDKETSGVLIIACHKKAAEFLTDQFKNKTLQKTYLAILVGKPPHSKGKVKAPLLKKEHTTEKVRVDFKLGKDAVTSYEVLKYKDGYSLVALSPITGRTHQLRVHMAHLGCPILGDGKYGGKKAQPKLFPTRITMHLHAKDLHLTLPTGRKKKISAKLPGYFEDTLRKLKLQ